jgi:hypothetical protein
MTTEPTVAVDALQGTPGAAGERVTPAGALGSSRFEHS